LNSLFSICASRASVSADAYEDEIEFTLWHLRLPLVCAISLYINLSLAFSLRHQSLHKSEPGFQPAISLYINLSLAFSLREQATA